METFLGQKQDVYWDQQGPDDKAGVPEARFEEIFVGDPKHFVGDPKHLASTPICAGDMDNPVITPTGPNKPEKRGRICSIWCVCLVAGVLVLGALSVAIYLGVGRNMQRSIGGVQKECRLVAVEYTWRDAVCSCGVSCSFACRADSCVKPTVGLADDMDDDFINSTLTTYDIDVPGKCYSSNTFPPCFNETSFEPQPNCTFTCYYASDSPLPPPHFGLKRKFSRQEQMVAVTCIGLILIAIIVAGLCVLGKSGGVFKQGVGDRQPLLRKFRLPSGATPSTPYIL